VFIHYSAGDPLSEQRAQRLAALLRDQDFAVVAVRSVPFGIERPSVRYFFDENRPTADRLAQLSSLVLPPAARGRGPTDFTHFNPKPQPGTVEVWLPTG
jgi:hypothetical protein